MYNAHTQACINLADRFMREFPEMSRVDVTRLLTLDETTISAFLAALLPLDTLERECLLAKLPTLIKRTQRN